MPAEGEENQVPQRMPRKENQRTVSSLKKPLGLLQQSAENEGRLIGRSAAAAANKNRAKNKKKERPPPAEGPTEVSAEDPIEQQLTAEEASSSYWERLAEQRRIALQEALVENDKLHEDMTVLKAENEILLALVAQYENIGRDVERCFDGSASDNETDDLTEDP